MPLGFPSHQGLVAPLWRRWPDRFSVLALWVGALVPDLVDGIGSIAQRGNLGQWIGHSLVGATFVGVPVALALTATLRRLARRLARRGRPGRLRRLVQRGAGWTYAIDRTPAPIGARLRFDAFSAWIGAVSHVLLDLPTHEHTRLLWPFANDPAWLGEGWRTVWFRVSVPGYPEYPIGPHFVAWIVLSAAGIVMFLRWRPRIR